MAPPDALYRLHLTESQLGAASTVLATVPDLAVALMIRAAFASIIRSEVGDVEAAATMLASAVHDQVRQRNHQGGQERPPVKQAELHQDGVQRQEVGVMGGCSWRH